MATQLQNRLVGTVILVALAVIILPDLLDGQKRQQQQAYETIPLQPEGEVPSEPVQLPEVERKQSTNNDDAALAVTADNAPAVSDKSANDNEGFAEALAEPKQATLGEEAFVIQLGVFRNADSVRELVTQLQSEGFRAYASPVTTSSGQLTKLMVGPDASKDRLEGQLQQLQALTELKGKVLKYQP
ncbi:MAG: SPOR domain-containing protein [Idiomarina sp.]